MFDSCWGKMTNKLLIEREVAGQHWSRQDLISHFCTFFFHRPTFNLLHRCSTRPSFCRQFSTWISFRRHSLLQLNHINWKEKEVNKLNIGHSLNYIDTWNESHTLSFLLLYDSTRRINCSCALCNSLIGSARLLNNSVRNQLYSKRNSALRSILTWSFTWNY